MKSAAQTAALQNLKVVIRKEARDRWSGATLAHLTPDRVQQILRNATTGSFTAQWELFDLMEDTWPRLKKNLNELKRAVAKVDLTPMPYLAEGVAEPSKRAVKKRDLLHYAIWNTRPKLTADENSWEDALYDSLDAVGKGISLQETLWETRDTPFGPAVLPRAWQWVYPRHYSYQTNNPALLLNVAGDGKKWEPIPANQFVLATFKTKTGHLLTSGLLRTLAGLWIGASFASDWALNLAQMFGLPIRWATYDPSQPHLLDDICEMLENLGSAGWGAFPAGTTLELKEAVSRAADNPQAFLVNMADVACDLLILGQTLTSDTGAGGSGSRALGEVHFAVRGDVIEHAGRWLAKVWSYQFVPALMRLNFGDNEEDPFFASEIRTKKNALEMAQRDKVLLAEMHMPVRKTWLYARHDVPIPERGDSIFEPGKLTGGNYAD